MEIAGGQGQKGKTLRMTIEMQLGEDYIESNLFIQPHLQSPSCLLSFQTWQTNKYTHLCMNAHRRTQACTALHFMKETEVLRLSRRWNLEKWKCCICILICPQSGIVFGVAVKLPGVCSSSLFIRVPWETGLKFKSACYHSLWRWVFLSFFLFVFCSLSSVTHSLEVCFSKSFFIFSSFDLSSLLLTSLLCIFFFFPSFPLLAPLFWIPTPSSQPCVIRSFFFPPPTPLLSLWYLLPSLHPFFVPVTWP